MPQRLERIYREHRQGLYTLALSVTRRPEQAEDAVHEAFIRLCRTPPPRDGDAVAYTYRAVRNAAIDQVRRRRTAAAAAASIFDDRDDDATPRPEEAVFNAERDRMLRQAVEELPDDQRQAVVMKLYGGLTFDQIAGVLGEPLSTVASRYRRALQKLRQAVESLI